MLFVENAVGLICGVTLGLLTWFFKFIEHKPYCMWLKAIYFFFCQIGPIMAGDITGWPNAKFLGALFFGYTCFRIWGEKGKPKQQLAIMWFWLQPIFFGSVGA